MLKSIDVLIGLTVVMLIVSMAVTMLTQAITSAVQSRGKHLREGIAQLLERVDPGISGELRTQIAHAVLMHPLIRGSSGLGTVIHREELIGILLDIAAGTAPAEPMLKEVLFKSLQRNGIEDPEKAMQSIRGAALEIEKYAPELANHVRNELAILQAASSDFVAKIHAWFDSTMDRVSERFTAHARVVTFAAATLVAVLLQFDALALVNRLTMEDALREALTVQAKAIAQNQTDPSAPRQDAQLAYTHALEQTGVITLPHDFGQWMKNWEMVNPVGVCLSALLLTLGAPFWYDVLKKLINLRSVIAGKDDQQRNERQKSTAKVPKEVLERAP